MTWKLFLDDEREPVHSGFMIARTYESAVLYIEENGLPEFISFDHDLGTEKSGHDLAKWIVEYLLDNHPDNLFPEYYVHSQNPVGKTNIETVVDNYNKWVINRIEFERN